MSNWTSAAFGMPATNPADRVVFARASQQRAAVAATAAHGCAKRGYAKRVVVIPAGVRDGVDLTADVSGARAWSPPV